MMFWKEAHGNIDCQSSIKRNAVCDTYDTSKLPNFWNMVHKNVVLHNKTMTCFKKRRTLT
jgi:hypothetical protein